MKHVLSRVHTCVVCALNKVILSTTVGMVGCVGSISEGVAGGTAGLDIRVAAGASIASAINNANAGDRILVPAGTYLGGGWIERRGTASAPITIVSVDGPRRAIIQGGNETLRVGNSAYLVFDGFEVRNSSDNAVHIDGSRYITLRNMYVHDAGIDGDAIKVNQSDHITIESSEIARPGRRSAPGENPYQECVDFVNVDDSVIRDNFIHDGGSMLAFVKGGSRNTVIERNVFSQQRSGASDPMVGLGGATDVELLEGAQYEAFNIVFRNNIVMNGVAGGVGIYNAKDAYVANNLFLNNDRAVIDFRAGQAPSGKSDNVQIVNNLFVDTRGRMPTPFRLSSDGLTGLSTSYNLYWNNGAPLPTTTLLTLALQTGHLSANPILTVPATTADRATTIATLRQSIGAAAADSGRDTSVAPFGVVVDINNVARGLARDRGPFAIRTLVAPAIPSGGNRVTSVAYTASPSPGTVGRPVAIAATSAGSTHPRYRYWLVTPTGVWTQPCGDYGASATCVFTPSVAGTYQIAVSARDANSTARYDATADERPFLVNAADRTAPATTRSEPPASTPESTPAAVIAATPVAPVTSSTRSCTTGLDAFPGAQGFGACASGARGTAAHVMRVTSLGTDASTPGTFPYAVSNRGPSGPRFVTFAVSGVVPTTIEITRGDLTIAGQTSPGGITVKGLYCDNVFTPGNVCNNVVIRHIRSRQNEDGLRLQGPRNVIIDHCSFGNATDETVQISNASNITIQNSILAEAVGDHYEWGGMLINYSSTEYDLDNLSIHHNLFSRLGGRMPEISCEENPFSERGAAPLHSNCTGKTLHMELSNNVLWDQVIPIYYNACTATNEGNYCLDEGSPRIFNLNLNWVNNQSLARSGYDDGMMLGYMSSVPGNSLYYSGNTISSGTLSGGGPTTGATMLTSRAAFPNVAYHATTDLLAHLRTSVGAFPRDPMDARITGYLASSLGATTSSGGRDMGDALRTVGSPPAMLADSDDDGIPDTWESTLGLNARNPADALTMASDGYLNIERYLNALSDRRVLGLGM